MLARSLDGSKKTVRRTKRMDEMSESKYFVMMNNRTVAENLSKDTALRLMSVLMEEYCADYDTVIAVAKMPEVEE